MRKDNQGLMQKARFIFITGGVMSSLGKGIAAAALGALLRARGFKIRLRKLDPYLNVDSGTMSPYQHGEVFVTEDGAETDLDLGHYERFTGVNASREDCLTTGQLYLNVITKERRGDYLGQTIQIIPHVTDEIKQAIKKGEDKTDFIICEIGGTIGDIEGLPFLEAIRQIRNDEGTERSLFVHLAWIPYIEVLSELKTKPAQHSVKELQRAGIQPNLLVCRCERPLPLEIRKKLGLFGNIPFEDVIEARNVSNIYEAPIAYHEAGLDVQVCKYFNNNNVFPKLTEWKTIVDSMKLSQNVVKIGVIGKYTDLPDAYKSLYEALIHGGIANHVKVNVCFMEGEKLESINAFENELSIFDGILIPGGFGKRGSEGKIKAIRYARENNIPFFGICLGMQLAIVEGMRNILGLKEANSSEFEQTACPVIALLEEWMDEGKLKRYQACLEMGGTMRLGAYRCQLDPGSGLCKIYGLEQVSERHRHRYEVNNVYRDRFEEMGITICGTSFDKELVEAIERKDHPWFYAVQFHPEFKSRPFSPHPLFADFIKASILFKDKKTLATES